MFQEQHRRLGIWRRAGSVYVSLNGDVIRSKDLAISVAETDGRVLMLSGNVMQAPPVVQSTAVTEWGLPQSVCAAFNRQGISALYDWQQECLARVLSAGGSGRVSLRRP